MFSKWVLTVDGLITSCRAISGPRLPSAAWRRISSSRAVRRAPLDLPAPQLEEVPELVTHALEGLQEALAGLERLGAVEGRDRDRAVRADGGEREPGRQAERRDRLRRIGGEVGAELRGDHRTARVPGQADGARARRERHVADRRGEARGIQLRGVPRRAAARGAPPVPTTSRAIRRGARGRRRTGAAARPRRPRGSASRPARASGPLAPRRDARCCRGPLTSWTTPTAKDSSPSSSRSTRPRSRISRIVPSGLSSRVSVSMPACAVLPGCRLSAVRSSRTACPSAGWMSPRMLSEPSGPAPLPDAEDREELVGERAVERAPVESEPRVTRGPCRGRGRKLAQERGVQGRVPLAVDRGQLDLERSALAVAGDRRPLPSAGARQRRPSAGPAAASPRCARA